MIKVSWVPRLLLFCLAVCVAPLPITIAQNLEAPLSSQANRFQTEKISRDGFDLYYLSLGAGEPVLILSGGPGDDCDYLLPVGSNVAKYAHTILLE